MISPHQLSRALGLFLAGGLLTVGLPVLGFDPPVTTPEDAPVLTNDPNIRRVAAADSDFGLRLLNQLNTATPNANIFISPYSVSHCLSMVLNGAGGSTKTDMQTALGLKSLNLNQINQGNQLLPTHLNPDRDVQLSIANAIWAGEGTPFSPAFANNCTSFYDARAYTLDFDKPDAAATINTWVKDNTQGKIDKLVSPGDIKDAVAVLTDAVYFHGQWSQPFNPSYTKDTPFTCANGDKKSVPMMLQYGSYSYLETSEFQAISLPYGQGQTSLYFFLPKSGTDINSFLKGLNATSWEHWMSLMQPTNIAVMIPRFHADYQTVLNTSLTALGMGSAFTSSADFKPMGIPGAYLSKVIHKTTLDVDEAGTEASAATGVVMPRSAHILSINVDHPFFVAIRDNTTGTLLFAGVIRDPK